VPHEAVRRDVRGDLATANNSKHNSQEHYGVAHLTHLLFGPVLWLREVA
jgi:hypothetical protein